MYFSSRRHFDTKPVVSGFPIFVRASGMAAHISGMLAPSRYMRNMRRTRAASASFTW
nr:hypothetical protein [uncultured Parolsenella sp.]